MNLRAKKELAAKVLKVGKEKIVFLKPRLEEIKEAITKQDIKDLKTDGAIVVKEAKGRKKVKKINNRSQGNVRKKVNTRKKEYLILTRKLRKYALGALKRGEISKEESIEARKKIRNRFFRSKNHMKEYIGGLAK